VRAKAGEPGYPWRITGPHELEADHGTEKVALDCLAAVLAVASCSSGDDSADGNDTSPAPRAMAIFHRDLPFNVSRS